MSPPHSDQVKEKMPGNQQVSKIKKNLACGAYFHPDFVIFCRVEKLSFLKNYVKNILKNVKIMNS